MLAQQAKNEISHSTIMNQIISTGPLGCGSLERIDRPPGLLEAVAVIDQFFSNNILFTSQIREMNKTQISVLKSSINRKVELANELGICIRAYGLKEAIHQHANHSKCNHMMQSCIRSQDPIMEILSHLRAAVSSTRNNFSMLKEFNFEII